MNKAEMIKALAKEQKCSKACAERNINAMLNVITRGLRRDKEVMLVGFGTFRVKRRRARKGVNPRTGEPIRIRASRSVSFKVGKVLKASV